MSTNSKNVKNSRRRGKRVERKGKRHVTTTLGDFLPNRTAPTASENKPVIKILQRKDFDGLECVLKMSKRTGFDVTLECMRRGIQVHKVFSSVEIVRIVETYYREIVSRNPYTTIDNIISEIAFKTVLSANEVYDALSFLLTSVYNSLK